MSAHGTTIPIHHNPVIHSVQTTRSHTERSFERPGKRSIRLSPLQPGRTSQQQYTLLELVEAIGEVTEDDREIVATVVHMLASGRVRLCGSFRDEPIGRILAG